MALQAVPREEYERLMHALGVPLDSREFDSGGVIVAAQADGCYYVDPVVFHLATGEEPVVLPSASDCARALPWSTGRQQAAPQG